jgi:hypothetical protein
MVGVVHLEIKKKEVKMPNYDKTGPEGSGALTGKKRGLCSGLKKETNNPENTENERLFGRPDRHRGRQYRGNRFGGNKSRKNR